MIVNFFAENEDYLNNIKKQIPQTSDSKDSLEQLIFGLHNLTLELANHWRTHHPHDRDHDLDEKYEKFYNEINSKLDKTISSAGNIGNLLQPFLEKSKEHIKSEASFVDEQCDMFAFRMTFRLNAYNDAFRMLIFWCRSLLMHLEESAA